MDLRSKWEFGEARECRRGLLCGMGVSPEEQARPLIGVVNSWNEYNPGHVHLKALAERYSKEDVAAFSRKIPVGRGGKVEEIVPMIQFLADVEKARFIVGQVICVDGGQSCDGSIESMNFPLSFVEA